jgi:CRP/FNR family cyclic AMP-dependent transcriptional regulator
VPSPARAEQSDSSLAARLKSLLIEDHYRSAVFRQDEMTRMPQSEFDVTAIPVSPDNLMALKDGGVVYIKGDAGDQAYLVRDGRVEIREAGLVLETIEPGELFGEMAVIDSEPRTASAVAIGPTELVRIEPRVFHSLVRDVPGFAMAIMRLMARRLRAVQGSDRSTEALPLSQKSMNSAG